MYKNIRLIKHDQSTNKVQKLYKPVKEGILFGPFWAKKNTFPTTQKTYWDQLDLPYWIGGLVMFALFEICTCCDFNFYFIGV